MWKIRVENSSEVRIGFTDEISHRHLAAEGVTLTVTRGIGPMYLRAEEGRSTCNWAREAFPGPPEFCSSQGLKSRLDYVG
jgi:hypothetical protein